MHVPSKIQKIQRKIQRRQHVLTFLMYFFSNILFFIFKSSRIEKHEGKFSGTRNCMKNPYKLESRWNEIESGNCQKRFIKCVYARRGRSQEQEMDNGRQAE